MRSPYGAGCRVGLFAAAAAFLVACGSDQATAPEPAANLLQFAPAAAQPAERFVVRLVSSDMSVASSAVSKAGGRIERSIGALGLVEVSGLSDRDAAALRADPAIAEVYRDVRQRWIRPIDTGRRVSAPAQGPRAQGTDQRGAFFFPLQWNLHVIRAPEAWLVTPGGSGALVCVLDTGVDEGQMDLVGRVNLAKSASMVPSEPFIEDLNGHGTYTSSLVSSNGLGMASVAPDAQLCAVKVLDQTGSGSFFDLAAGIVFAADQGADVINMSLSGVIFRDDPVGRFFQGVVEEAVRYASNAGALLVAAAGNDGADLDLFPGARILPGQFARVVAVSATAPFNQANFDGFAGYSNSGQRLVGMTAPGGDFLVGGVVEDLVIGACSRFVCGADGFYFFASGTSGSSPHVAGGGAIVEGAKAGNQDGSALRQCLHQGAVHIDALSAAQQGAGRLDVRSAAAARC